MPDVPALRRMRQEDLKFEASLDYLILLSQRKKQKPQLGMVVHVCNFNTWETGRRTRNSWLFLSTH